MSILRRKSTTEAEAVDSSEELVEPVETGGKGRPTPKRRTGRAPVAKAPKTRKEAVAWQKQHAQRGGTVAGQKKLTGTEYRQALRTGEVLPRRDQGPVRALARDYVDSRRMLSNYMLWLFPLLIVGMVVPLAQVLVFLVFIAMFAESIYTGARIKRLALDRGLKSGESALTLGFYTFSRAYFKRSWRRPLPVVELGDKL